MIISMQDSISRNASNNGRGGFSLIEVMMALVLLGLLFSGAYTLLTQSSHTQHVLKHRDTQMQDITMTLHHLSEDIGHIVHRNYRLFDEGNALLLRPIALSYDSRNTVYHWHMTRYTDYNPALPGQPLLWRVTYLMQEQRDDGDRHFNIYRLMQPMPPAINAPPEPAQAELLLANIADITVELWRHSQRPGDTWQPFISTQNIVPVSSQQIADILRFSGDIEAIRLTLILKEGVVITRIITLPDSAMPAADNPYVSNSERVQ